MNKKIVFLTCVIGIIALLAISATSAEKSDVDTSDWVNITVYNTNFQIPPEYGGGSDSFHQSTGEEATLEEIMLRQMYSHLGL